MDEKVSKILNNPNTIPVSIGVISFGIGVGLGYLIGRGKSKRKRYIHAVPKQDFDNEAMEEYLQNEETRLGITPKPTEGIHPIFVESDPDQETIITIKPVEEDVEPVTQNIFNHDDDDWDYDIEVTKRRNPEVPYVLHRDEFYNEEGGLPQQSLTYYAGDNIMVDQEDAPIYNFDQIVGELVFGHGSGDSKVFYVRNEKRRAEYEVIFDPGLYSVEVLGLEIENNERAKEVKHSAPKFRMTE